MPDLTLQPLTLQPMSEDLLEAAVGLDQLCLGGLWNLAGYQHEFERDISTLLALTAQSLDLTPGLEPTQSGKLLIGMGCSWRILEEMHITLVAVHPDYQRSGLGQLLLLWLLWIGSQQKLERATLEVRESNQAALALYAKFGFQVAGRRRRYYADTGEDGLILWRGEIDQPEFRQMLRQAQQQMIARLEAKNWHLKVASELTPCV